MTKDDNTQAVALAKVVKHFADAGFEPYLRWGHEMVSGRVCISLGGDD